MVAGSPLMQKLLANKNFTMDVLKIVSDGYKTLVESEFAVSNFQQSFHTNFRDLQIFV